MITARFRSVVLSLILLAGAAQAAPGLVLKHPDPGTALADRWGWAFRTATGGPYAGGFWVGYSIRRKMSENSFIGSFNWPSRSEDWTLAGILSGRKISAPDPQADERSVREAARRALDEIENRTRPERIVDKEIAVLFRFRPSSGAVPVEMEYCDLQSLFDPKGAPLLWLGPAGDADSLAALDRFYSGPAGIEVKKDIVGAAGLHQSSGLALPFLERAASPASPEAIRIEAAEALAEQATPRAVEVLRRLIAEDRSPDVRREAVSALAESPVPAALDALIETASKSPDKAVRVEALEGLAEKASARATAALNRAAFDDKDTEVQKEAVSALAELPRGESLPALTNVARTHANPEVRKAAIEALAEIGGPEVVGLLAELARGKK
jgi:hypothetical protein